VIRVPSTPPRPAEDPVVVICRDPGRRALLERLISPAQIHASAVEAVLSAARRTPKAVVLNLEDLAGAERDLLGALRRAQPDTQIYAVVAPEDEPLARSLRRDGVSDYFIVPGDVNRLPRVLAGEVESPAEIAPPTPAAADPMSGRLAEAACSLAGLAMAESSVLLKNGASIILRALGAERGCFFTLSGPGGELLLTAAACPDPAEPFDMERSVAERAVHAGEPLLLEMPWAAAGSVLCVPARESCETFGVLCLAGKSIGSAGRPIRTAAETLVRALSQLYRAAAQREEFARLAHRDAETGLLRSEAFLTYLGRLITRADDEQADVAVIIIKPQTADGAPLPDVLARTGRALASRLSEGRLGGRLGADSFAIAWAQRRPAGEKPDQSRLRLMAQAGSLADLGLFGDPAPRLRMNLSVFPQDGSDARSLVAVAEAGLMDSER
jgi:DNA-binding NarL/FixJ family response regulator